MSKELDELQRGIIEFEKDLEDDCNNEWLKRVVAGMKKCYQRLEAIDNAKTSEALKELELVENWIRDRELKISNVIKPSLNTIKQSLLKAQEQEKELKTVRADLTIELNNKKNAIEMFKQERELREKQEQENTELKKVLEIIKKKGFDRSIEDYDNYNIWVEYKVEQFDKAIEKNPTILNWDVFDKFTYTQEEFDLLKRYLNDK